MLGAILIGAGLSAAKALVPYLSWLVVQIAYCGPNVGFVVGLTASIFSGFIGVSSDGPVTSTINAENPVVPVVTN